MNAVRHFLVALQFLTRIPVRGRLAGWIAFTPQMLRASAGHFPGVGLLVGACSGAVLAASAWLFAGHAATPWIAALAAIAAGVLLTGAFHEDGLADTVDGLGGSADPQRALAIMKDSRIGSFGALALVLAIAGKAALLAALLETGIGAAWAALLAAHACSRLAALGLMASLPYVRDPDQAKAKPLAGPPSPAALWAGCLWSAAALALATRWAQPRAILQAGAAAGLAFVLMRRLFARRLGGCTGDCLGATQQLAELAFYAGMLART